MTRGARLLRFLMIGTTVGLLWPTDVAAQRHATGRPSTGAAVARPYAPRYYRPYYPRYYSPRFYYPYAYRYYSPWYYPYYPGFSFGVGFGYGWPGYWGAYGYGYGYPYANPYAYPYWYDNTGSARLQVTPRHAQVYVDGRFVGLVDDFDGTAQRLRLGNGTHELQIYLEGYRTLTQNVMFTPGTTVRIQTALQPLGPGETTDPKPTPNRTESRSERYEAEVQAPRRSGAPTDFGTLLVRVSPADAVISIDGEVWERPAGESRLSVDLAEGPHRIEITKSGYASYARVVELHRGRTFTLNVSLSAGDPRQLQISNRRDVTLRSYPQ